jgi:predicted metal-dependent hydrolase
MKTKLDNFVKCLDEERFYDAHEVLEEAWFPRRFEDSNEVKLLKGFINASVCFELYKKGRIEQSEKVWMNYLKYRQLLFRVDSAYLNDYNKISRYLEEINNKNKRKTQ